MTTHTQPTPSDLILDAFSPPAAAIPAPPERVRVAVHIPPAVLELLVAIGKGSASAGVEHAVRHIQRNAPELIPKMLVTDQKPAKSKLKIERDADRQRRDALIYHECLARTFTRKEIGKRMGLSEIRINQIYAEQSRNPPPYPANFTPEFVDYALEDQAHPKFKAASSPAEASIQSLIANWME